MTTRAATLTVVLLLTGIRLVLAGDTTGHSRLQRIRVIDKTTVVGDSDPVVWKAVLDLLPSRPRRIEVLDLDALSTPTRDKLRGLDAFVLSGQSTIVVIRQGATLRLAETGDGIDRLVLASLVWHELAHASGLDEGRALEWEQALWRRFIARGLVDGATGMSYIARLETVRRH